MGLFAHAGRRSGRVRPVEWPTWAVLCVCYSLWIGSVALAGWLAASTSSGMIFALLPAAVAAALHSSLQHEVLHGHPTRSPILNEALVFPVLGLFIPYRRFRDLHLRHHNDERLTDPFDDPESFYAAADHWQSASPAMRALLTANATLAGRLVIGPALALYGFVRSELRLLAAGDRRVWGAWLRHLPGVALVLAVVAWAGVPFWAYLVVVAYPAISLIMVRSFIEHRADTDPARRTAIVEGEWFWRILFLNNCYHAVHHDLPGLAWYRLPRVWRARRDEVLARNGGYLLPGYGAVFRRWLFRQREPVVHPYDPNLDRP